MSSSLIFRLVYGLIGIFGAFFAVTRLQDGNWLEALLPAAVAAFCVYRLFTFSEPEQ